MEEWRRIVAGYGLQAKSINTFEVEGWRLEVEGKGEENFFPQTSSDSAYEALAQ